MIGKIESCEKSKSGKSWRVKVSGKYYGAQFDSHLDKEVGKSIDFNVKSTDYGEWIESWAHANGAAPAAQTGGASSTNGSDRFYMPFVSNVVAHAIAAGMIQGPNDISAWAKSAYDAAQAIDAL